MKIALILLIFSSINTFAQVCDDNSQFGSLNVIAGKNCLSDEVIIDDIPSALSDPKKTKEFCKKCNDNVLNNILSVKEAKKEKASHFAKATLDEFQKELTFISIDLMRMRSSYSLPVDTRNAAAKCDFKKNLFKPKCLDEQQSKDYDSRIKDIQNSLASELSTVISGKLVKTESLLTRVEPSCKITDAEAIFSQMRFTESLLTPELIKALKEIQVPKGESLPGIILKDSRSELRQTILTLNMHPIFKNILNDQKKLDVFLKENSSARRNSDIIENLYAEKQSLDFEKSLSSRCNSVFEKTSKYLDQIYCKESPIILADDAKSMQIVSDASYSRLSEIQVENELKTFCSQINTAPKESLSFSQIRSEINGINDKTISNEPLSIFKREAYNSMYSGPVENLCNAIKTKECEKNNSSFSCRLLAFYENSKKSPEYKKLAKASNEKIDNILRSLVGEGIPQKDGKPDQEAISLLKSEGILPGGDTTSRPPQQTASAFHKTVNSQQPQPQPQTQATAKPAAVSPSKPEVETQSSYSQSAARDDKDDEDDSTPSSQTESHKTKTSSKPNSKFSNLSDDEQKRIMDMMKRSKKAGGKTPSVAASDSEETESSSFPSSGNSMASIASQAADSAPSVAAATPAPSAGSAAGKKATLDPTKKSSSLNDAMVDANTNRQPASSGSSSTGAQVSMSKTAANENEIKIKVADAELTQVNEFKEKLKVLLNAHSQEISVAGAGEKFVVKLNNFEINVVYNKALGSYEALCKDSSIPKDYLKTISNYFNVTLKGSSGKREALINTLKQ